MAFHTGLKARIYGVLWGSLFATIGTGGFLFFVTTYGLIPSALQQVVVDLTPLSESIVRSTPTRLVPLALMVLFALGMAVFACYGLYVISQAIFQDEYTIRFTSGSRGGM